MREIAAEVHTKFQIDRIAMAHRLGRLEIGEPACSLRSARRIERPFEACRFCDRYAEAVGADLEERIF